MLGNLNYNKMKIKEYKLIFKVNYNHREMKNKELIIIYQLKVQM